MKQRPYCDTRASMAKNVLLVRNKVGRAAPTTQDLPNEDFRYGYVYPQGEGVAECMKGWEEVENRPQTARRTTATFRPREDFVATNRAAVRHGCRTAKDFREYQLNHGIMEKQDTGDLGAEQRAQFHERVVNMTHGIPTPVSSEMKDCLTYRYCREAKERAMHKRELEATRKRELGIKMSTKAKMARAARPTRASRGQTYQAYKPPKESETFKMKRFLAIDHCAIQAHW